MAFEVAADTGCATPETDGSDTGFGARLRAARLCAGFATARQLASALGLGENRYTRYERGETEPSLGTIARICRILGVTPDELMGFASFPEGIGRATGQHAGFREPIATEPSPSSLADAARLLAGRRRWLSWQLARACSTLSAPPADVPPETALIRLRRTCELHRQIEQDPLGFIEATVESPAIDSLPPARQLALADAIEALCALLSQSPSREISPRDQAQ